MPKINTRKEIIQCPKALIKKNEKSLKDIKKTLPYEVDLMENEEYFYIYRWILSLKAKFSVYESSRYLTKVRQPVLRRYGNFFEDMLNMDEGRFVQHARMS
ncbi:hypothetical protein G6F56_008643 [Rhizopus delemar]|nr:hypothetical protein G6F56_008643 [Rhizopus delemar]